MMYYGKALATVLSQFFIPMTSGAGKCGRDEIDHRILLGRYL